MDAAAALKNATKLMRAGEAALEHGLVEEDGDGFKPAAGNQNLSEGRLLMITGSALTFRVLAPSHGTASSLVVSGNSVKYESVPKWNEGQPQDTATKAAEEGDTATKAAEEGDKTEEEGEEDDAANAGDKRAAAPEPGTEGQRKRQNTATSSSSSASSSSSSAPSSSAASPSTKRKPAGRPPRGKVWDQVAGEWVPER